MPERITGGTLAQSQSIGENVQEGARRLAKLGDGIVVLENSKAQIVEIQIQRANGSESTVPVSRAKLLELLVAEREHVGQTLARILGTLYPPR